MQAPTRESLIALKLTELSGDDFERFSVELIRREYYPAIVPTSASYDGGSDANTYASLVTLQDGKRVKVAASHTGTLTKLTSDCEAITAGGEDFDVLVFATSRDVRTDTQEEWKAFVKQNYGWDLEVHTIRSIAPLAANDRYEKLVYDRLGIPPFGGDFLSDIELAFARETGAGLSNAQINLPGLNQPLPREEVGEVADQLTQFKPVLLLGKGGEGKTGIGVLLIQSRPNDLSVLYLDARRFANVTNRTQLREHLGLKGDVINALAHVATKTGCLLVADQLDNIAGTPAGAYFVEFLLEASKIDRLMIVAISRRPIDNENNFLEPLSGFVGLEARPISEAVVRKIFVQFDIADPPDQLVELAHNLLNLNFILQILQSGTEADWTNIQDEVGLWELYRQSIITREGDHIAARAHNVVAEAVHLAREGLKSPDRSFVLEYPLKDEDARLAGRGVIVQISGRQYRFQHEKLQDYFYAWDAVQGHKTVEQVVAEVGSFRAPSVIQWMSKLLEPEPERRAELLKSILE